MSAFRYSEGLLEMPYIWFVSIERKVFWEFLLQDCTSQPDSQRGTIEGHVKNRCSRDKCDLRHPGARYKKKAIPRATRAATPVMTNKSRIGSHGDVKLIWLWAYKIVGVLINPFLHERSRLLRYSVVWTMRIISLLRYLNILLLYTSRCHLNAWPRTSCVPIMVAPSIIIRTSDQDLWLTNDCLYNWRSGKLLSNKEKTVSQNGR